MTITLSVCLEQTRPRTFASAIEWPGWSRSGKTPDQAVETLVAYGPRYALAMASEKLGVPLPAHPGEVEIAERLTGNSGTEFGTVSVAPEADSRPVSDDDLERLVRILKASWKTFDEAAARAAGRELKKGPRGGGRDVDKIVEHAADGDDAYLRELGYREKLTAKNPSARAEEVRCVIVDTLLRRQAGWDPPMGPRRQRPYWSIRYFVRRAAWHSLDHAWEIEDRMI